MKSYFSLEGGEGDLKEKVKRHFDQDLKAEPNDVIEKLLDLKREEKGGKIRGMRPLRNPN